MGLQRFTSLQPLADLPQVLAPIGTKQDNGRGRKPGAGWYTISNVTDSDTEIYIYEEIGYWGVTANDFISDLRDIKASKIALHINSPGGDVFDGIAIYNAIARHKAEVTVWINGIAASAEWRARMKDEAWFSDAEAVEAGLADRVDGEEAVAAKADVPVRDHLPTLNALREGTAARRKQPLPEFDFTKEVKEALSA